MSSSLHVFRSSPTINIETYINWLDIVEKKKEQIWKNQGIYDLSQLSITGPKYNPNMLISALLLLRRFDQQFSTPLWNDNPHSFRCGCYTGLRPSKDTFNPILKHKIKPNFSFTRPGFSNYIEDHHEDTEEISNYEHIAFLILWLSVTLGFWHGY